MPDLSFLYFFPPAVILRLFFFSKMEDSLVRLSHLTWWRLVLASRSIVYLGLFHVGWSDFAVVFSTEHVLVWSNVEPRWSFTVFAVVFQALVYIHLSRSHLSHLKWPCRATITNHLGQYPDFRHWRGKICDGRRCEPIGDGGGGLPPENLENKKLWNVVSSILCLYTLPLVLWFVTCM